MRALTTNVIELNTRLWLRELGLSSLADVPDDEIDRLAALGFSAVWLMGVWRPSALGAQIARQTPDVVRACERALPGCQADDIVASPYAIPQYVVAASLGGERALASLRSRLAHRGMRLWLDFVPNHTAPDNGFVTTNPSLYIQGESLPMGDSFLAPDGVRIAHGKDPYFPPWRDTAQLDYRKEITHEAMTSELLRVARLCDGVRCDMAMLLQREVFANTWGHQAIDAIAEDERAKGEFWARAIDAVRAQYPDFTLVAEAYWGMEERLESLGFDLTYDKSFYDVLAAGDAPAIVGALRAAARRLRRGLRFLENHDEPRASRHFELPRHRLAALLAFALPGGRLVHQGQLEGHGVQLPVQLARGPREAGDPVIASFYEGACRVLRDRVLGAAEPSIVQPEPAWAANASHTAFVALAWDGSAHTWGPEGGHRLLVLNFAEQRAQCRLRLPLPGLGGRRVVLSEIVAAGDTPVGDALSASRGPAYMRDGDELGSAGLFVDMPPQTGHLLWVGPEAFASVSLAAR